MVVVWNCLELSVVLKEYVSVLYLLESLMNRLIASVFMRSRMLSITETYRIHYRKCTIFSVFSDIHVCDMKCDAQDNIFSNITNNWGKVE